DAGLPDQSQASRRDHRGAAPARWHRAGPHRGRGLEPRLPSRDPRVRAAHRDRRRPEYLVQPARRAAGRLAGRRGRHLRALGAPAPGAGAVPDFEEVAVHFRGGTMLNEFRTFIIRGNMIDLAVGLVIGAAFTTVVTSFVNDLLMPPIGLLLGRVDFANLFVTLGSGSFPT